MDGQVDIVAAQKRITVAHDMVDALGQPMKIDGEWLVGVDIRKYGDPDVVLGAALNDAHDLLDEVVSLRKALDDARWHADHKHDALVRWSANDDEKDAEIAQLREALGELVDKAGTFEKSILIAKAILQADTPQGAKYG